MTSEEKKRAKEEKKLKKALKIAKCRPFKNFLWFLFGFIFSFIFIAGSFFVVAKFVPIKTFFGEGDDKVSANVKDKAILDIVMNVDSLKVNDFPIIVNTLEDTLNDIDLIEGLLEFDFETLNDLKFSEVSSKIGGVVKVVATLQSITDKFDISLGDFAEMSVFKTWEEVEEPVNPETANDKLYYYQVNAGAQKPVYAKAIENGAFVTGVDGSTKLYYPALNEIVVLEAFDIMADRIQDSKAKDLLNAFMSISDDSAIDKIIGDKKIKELGDLDINTLKLIDFDIDEEILDMLCNASNADPKPTKDTITIGDLADFDTDKIKLSSVMDVDANEDLFNLIKEATNFEGDIHDIALSDLKNFAENNIKLSSVLDYDANEDLFKLVKEASGFSGDAKDITLNDLNNFVQDNIKLSSVLDYEANEDLFKLVKEASGFSGDAKDITLNDLNNFVQDNIKLSSVLDYDENEDLFKLIKQASGFDGDAKDITLNDLNNFVQDDIKLSCVLDYDANEDLFTIIKEATAFGGDAKDITIGTLKNFDANNIKLSAVIEVSENENLFTIIKQATGFDGDAKDITIGTLKNFNADNLKLSAVIEVSENEKLFTIIKEATGYDGNVEDITLGAMKDFNVENIHLSTVMESSENVILNVLLSDPNVTLGNLGESVDNLLIEDVYPATCFEEKVDGLYVKLTNGGYVLATEYSMATDGAKADDKMYNVSKEAKVWFLFYYTSSSEIDEYGNAERFVRTNKTIGEMQGVFNEVSEKFQISTIRQLVDMGVLTDPEYALPELYAKTVMEMINPSV